MLQEWIVESYQLSDMGQKRQHNEDYVGFFEPDQPEEWAVSGRLYLVVGGVGGAALGKVVSQYAVKKILHDFYNSPEPDLKTQLLNVTLDANADIFERNSRHPEHREMTMTLIVALIHVIIYWWPT
jgi:serine/threonine protein phosphatase PrpC